MIEAPPPQRPPRRRAAIHARLPVVAGMKVGLLGGSFDPPHAGHLHAARTAMKQLGLDRVVWLVSPGNPLKPARADDLARRVAAARSVAKGRRMIVSGIEADLHTRFTLDTIRALQRRHPGVRFVWLMGADNLLQFNRWRDWPRIFTEIPIAVIARPGFVIRARLSPAARRFAAERLPASRARLLPAMTPPAWTYLQAPWNFTSSTELRSRLRAPGD
jgi:nicotinate-nucleotide adenylyltransferase